MSKKIRKKKEIENVEYDILQLDKRIKEKIEKELQSIEKYKNQLESIYDDINNKKLSYREKKKLKIDGEELSKKINKLQNNEVLLNYLCETQKIISDYMKILEVPVNISFFSSKKQKSSEEDTKKEELLQKFLLIAKKYIDIKNFKKEKKKNIECECGNNSQFVFSENCLTCEVCGMESNIYTINTNFKDIDRVNLSQKYKYSKRVYFRDTVNRYEGKQNKKIDTKVYNDIGDWFKRHNLLCTDEDNFHLKHKNIKKEHIYMALSETGNNLHYEDINLLHNYFTGIPCPDISSVREEIFEDFDKLMNAYDSINTERVNSLNSQYILYQLLRRRKIKVNENDFGMLKTRDRLIEYDNIYKKLCLLVEFQYIPSI